MLLAVGGVLAASIVLPTLPREREIHLRLEEPASITGLEMTWAPAAPSRSASSGAEPIAGSSWRFAAGAAPGRVMTTVRLPDGAYDLAIAVRRTDGTRSSQRTVTFDDTDSVTVPIR